MSGSKDKENTDFLDFSSDYLEGAHPRILQRLLETNLEKTPGYGLDKYCDNAREKIRRACNCPQAQVFFLSGGTQTNATVIGAVLRSYQGVIAAETGHISTHEAGAIEFGGHKVITLPHHQGKLEAAEIERCFKTYREDKNKDHMVMPGMVYLSHPTEYGTLYTRQELESISRICAANNAPLYLDGARLGYGLAADGTDVTLEVIANTCDVFYIGGTKVGALYGEAVVITKANLIPHFFTIMKQHGAVLSKGRLLGLQFDTLFTDNLYFSISGQAIEMVMKLKQALLKKGYRFFLESPTNQQFIILENRKMAQLKEKVGFSYWEPFDTTHSVIRLATSWATKEEDVDKLIELL
jgi:threonine aldolase